MKDVTVNRLTRVDAFMANLDHPLKAEVGVLRDIVLAADARIEESIKWNAPSFYVTEHFATFKLRPLETVQIVFHTGAKGRGDIVSVAVEDPDSLLTWAAKDRAVATFTNMNDVESNRAALTAIVKAWLARVG